MFYPLLLSAHEQKVLPGSVSSFLLLETVDCAPASTVSCREILISDREEVALLDSQLSIGVSYDVLQLYNDICDPLAQKKYMSRQNATYPGSAPLGQRLSQEISSQVETVSR